MEDGVRKRLRADEPQSLSSFDETSPSKRTRARIVPTYRNDDKGLPTNSSAADHDGAKKPEKPRKRAPTSSESEDEDDDDDYTSSSGSDDDSDSDSGSDGDGEDEDQEADYSSDQASRAGSSLPRISAQQKPRIHRMTKEPDLLSRLSAFLPKLKSANEDLQREIAAGRGKDLQLDEAENQEEGQYIEMNLGLGVLEEKRADGSSSTDEELGDGPEFANDEDAAESDTKLQKDSDILDKLMGKKKSSDQKPTIQELTEPRS
ncbi:hypothetical protein IFM58399_01520 [Aspergillus lentulus]|uniref:Uncharacterized protein n=1 Tax=Aspergillus lentulus TaxID=293939 RepID=A0AAN5YS66_ASPLE|nr:uncharacterized protein IFM58399_01520 [Aspergillus lentulus]KAF4207172.1 hypothetical protein CNMCM8927_003743 [Aspergillus lentulus]GFF26793.1 hypothetical protein IFM58399_01520 [Aspergillus lentulus]GFF47180.1 hypothetical protein IFM62136_00701 [Aspergillus lentulus]GFF66938.1 hypothetical protein IFM60648_02092 [Aspergillus lentulus]GFF79825.1 hypothetical protein IFM47457_05013 [Aspergillus lentulus]